jgi:hypothetical protein
MIYGLILAPFVGYGCWRFLVRPYIEARLTPGTCGWYLSKGKH